MREEQLNFLCPVCFFDRLPYPPEDFHICLCCGTEFGNDDEEYTLEELRSAWISDGAQWFYEQPPVDWNPWAQLAAAGYPNVFPQPQESLYNSAWDSSESISIRNEPLSVGNAQLALV